MLKKITLATALVAIATSAFAMSDADTNEDGMLTYDEVMAANPDITEDMFDEADLDGDGALDESEIADALEAGVLQGIGG